MLQELLKYPELREGTGSVSPVHHMPRQVDARGDFERLPQSTDCPQSDSAHAR